MGGPAAAGAALCAGLSGTTYVCLYVSEIRLLTRWCPQQLALLPPNRQKWKACPTSKTLTAPIIHPTNFHHRRRHRHNHYHHRCDVRSCGVSAKHTPMHSHKPTHMHHQTARFSLYNRPCGACVCWSGASSSSSSMAEYSTSCMEARRGSIWPAWRAQHGKHRPSTHTSACTMS